MFLLYFLAIIPVIIYTVLYFKKESVHLYEFLTCSVACLIIAGIFHISLFKYMTDDVEVLSGEIIKATFHPTWVEKYKVAHYKTVYSGSGKHRTSHRVFSHYTTHYRTHSEYWDCDTNLNTTKTINRDLYDEICVNFNNKNTETPFKTGFYSGDKHVYTTYKKTSYIYPVTKTQAWANRLKCSKTVFTYPSIPNGTKLFEYPVPTDWRASNRLINEPSINLLEFDRMNSRLGFMKKVNIILINFGENTDPLIAKYQEAKFLGGKKNDIVICYGNKVDGIPSWSYVFSWSENCLVKRNIETLLLSNKINNTLLISLEKEIAINYEIKDWKKFEYITIYPSGNSILLYVLICIILNAGMVWFITSNDVDKDGKYGRY